MIWYVTRRPNGSIACAHESEEHSEGKEPLDDQTDADLIAHRALVTARPPPSEAEQLRAELAALKTRVSTLERGPR